MKVLIATHNKGKEKEFLDMMSTLFSDIELQNYPRSFDVVEDQSTFRGNAKKKAREAVVEFGFITLADDSGLEVEALGNRPGIFSARFAGENASDEENNSKLVKLLRSEKNRKARFVAEVVLAIPGNELEQLNLSPSALLKGEEDNGVVFFYGRGECEGEIVDEPRGGDGFGYDPHFLIPEWNLTLAEVSRQKKATISHRARALKRIKKQLE